MTINAFSSRNEYIANAGQTIFNFTFKIFSDSDLNVYITTDGQTPNDATDITTNYTVSGVGLEDGGSITLNSGATLNDLITIVSNIPSNRTTDYQNNGDFKPDTVNDDFDRVVSLVKQVEELGNRSLLSQESQQGPKPLSLPSPESQNFLRWNTSLDGLENIPLSAIVPGGAFIDGDVVEKVNDILGLVNISLPVSGKTYEVLGYFVVFPQAELNGGGPFTWQPGLNKNLANGGTIIDPDNIGGFDGTVTTRDAFLAAQGGGVGVGCWVRQDTRRINIQDFGSVGDGTTDDSVAVQAAFDAVSDSNEILVPNPPVYYSIKDVTLPADRVMRGIGRTRIYNPSSISEIENTCAFVLISGGTNLIDFSARTQVFDINFWGTDTTVHGLGTGEKQNIFAYNCSFQKFINGIGTNLVTRNSRFWNCHANQNTTGIKNLVDSHVYSAEVNANTGRGIFQSTGANDTVFVGCKVEFNQGDNWEFFEANNCMVVGGVTDRSGGDFGAVIKNCTVSFTGTVFRRNGRFNATTSAHFNLESGVVLINGLDTSTGFDDGGGGLETPASVFRIGGTVANSSVVCSSSDLQGFTTALIPTSGSNEIFRGCLGIPDSSSYLATGTASVTDDVEIDSVSGFDPVGTFSSSSIYGLYLTVRDATSGARHVEKIVFLFRREGGSASVGFTNEQYDSTAIEYNTGGTRLDVLIENIATDASSFDIKFTGITTSSKSITWQMKREN